MKLLIISLWSVLWNSYCYALHNDPAKQVVQRQAEPPLALPCLTLMALAEQGVYLFKAKAVFDCIGQVPFNSAVALRFLDYYNQTLQFQSTLAFLEHPPEGYQQQPLNLQQELENIQADINAGSYKTQYAFEADLQLLVSRTHDAHVILQAGIFTAFTFASPYTLISLSEDGKKSPQIFLEDDVVSATKEGWTPSAVTRINNETALDYLTSLATLNSDGYVESHAEWNSIMANSARDIQGYLSALQRLTFYPGDSLVFTFSNGSVLETEWWAIYSEIDSTGPLSTPGDFYNYFVLNQVPAGYDQAKPTAWWPAEYNITLDTPPIVQTLGFNCSWGGAQPSNWCNATNGAVGAYPNNPVAIQSDLSITGTGSVSGYIFDDISTGVLSIPTFYQGGASVEYFFETVGDFIGNASARNAKHIVIDLQQNSGGLVFLALTTFQQFFPEGIPYTGSRIRSHSSADILGSAYSHWWQALPADEDLSTLYRQLFADSEWIPLNRINAVIGRSFSSWSEYFGPLADHGDAFSQQQTYNLSDIGFNNATFGWNYTPWTNRSYVAQSAPWAPEDIVLLTDGTCSSACAMFVELMAGQAGVRTISVGGRPTQGPMQTASGNRGAAVYTADYLDDDYYYLQNLVQNMTAYNRLPSRNNTGMKVNFASFNIRDQMRANETTPLQFRYEASDCRIYYTFRNAYNMSQLWRDAAAATWDNANLCVLDSTGYSKRTTNGRKQAPKPEAQQMSIIYPQLDTIEVSQNTSTGLVDSTQAAPYERYPTCQGLEMGESCSLPKTVCITKRTSCSRKHTVNVCVQRCRTANSRCHPLVLAQTAQNAVAKSAGNGASISLWDGYFDPGTIDARAQGLTCPN